MTKAAFVAFIAWAQVQVDRWKEENGLGGMTR